MKKNGLNVEHFRYHIAINYDKFIGMHLLIKCCIKKINI